MGGGLARSGRLIWRSLAIPVRVAGAHAPIGLLLNAALAAAFTWYGSGEKALRFVIPGGPVMAELTLPQVVVALVFLVTFIGMMVGNYAVKVGELEGRLAPRLSVKFDPDDPTCRQQYKAGDEGPHPIEIFRVRVENLSDATTLDEVRARISTAMPPDPIFEHNEYLEAMGGTDRRGRPVDAGAPLYPQVLIVTRPPNAERPDAQIDYASRRWTPSLQRPLPPGQWELTISVSCRNGIPVTERIRLTVPEDWWGALGVAAIDA